MVYRKQYESEARGVQGQFDGEEEMPLLGKRGHETGALSLTEEWTNTDKMHDIVGNGRRRRLERRIKTKDEGSVFDRYYRGHRLPPRGMDGLL